MKFENITINTNNKFTNNGIFISSEQIIKEFEKNKESYKIHLDEILYILTKNLRITNKLDYEKIYKSCKKRNDKNGVLFIILEEKQNYELTWGLYLYNY